MRVLPDISFSTQTPCVVLDTFTIDQLIERTQRIISAGSAHFILAGRYFRALKARLPYGHFIEVVELKFDWSIDTIGAWMAIEEAFPDPATWACLPSHWSTQIILTRIPQELRDQWIRNGKIHPRLDRQAARDLVREARRLTQEARAADDLGNDAERGGDSDRDGGGNDHRGDDERSEPRARSTRGIDPERADIDADSKAESARKDAYIEQLEAQARLSDAKIEVLERRVAELEAMAGLGDVGWNQRRLLTRAIDTAREAIENKDDSSERRRLQGDAGAYIVDLVRSAKRDELDIERFDLAYRPKPGEQSKQLTKDKESFVPQPGTEVVQLQ